jgi:TonB family protein
MSSLSRRICFSFLTTLLAASSLNSQSIQTASAGTINPDALLNAAMQANGLHGDSLQPWHIRGSWQIIEPSKSTNEGSFEEWWSAPQHAKIDVTGKDFQQTRYVVPNGTVYTGSAMAPDNIANLIEDAIRLPLPASAAGLRQSSVNQGGVALDCISNAQPKPDDSGPAGSLLSAYSACFAGSPPALRMEAGVSVQALFNSLVQFQRRYLARDVRFNLPSGKQIAVHLDVIQPLTAVPDSFFVPPADAQPLPARIELSEDVLLPTRISGHRPLYPYRARIDMIQGTAVLEALIRPDGTVGNLKVVSAPPLLGQAAMLGVQTWRFRPYMVNGVPVEVRTSFGITFACEGTNVCSYRDQN